MSKGGIRMRATGGLILRGGPSSSWSTNSTKRTCVFRIAMALFSSTTRTRSSGDSDRRHRDGKQGRSSELAMERRRPEHHHRDVHRSERRRGLHGRWVDMGKVNSTEPQGSDVYGDGPAGSGFPTLSLGPCFWHEAQRRETQMLTMQAIAGAACFVTGLINSELGEGWFNVLIGPV